jgi:hypothetical protein
MTDSVKTVAVAAQKGAKDAYVSSGDVFFRATSSKMQAGRVVAVVKATGYVALGVFVLHGIRTLPKQYLADMRNGLYPPEVAAAKIPFLERTQGIWEIGVGGIMFVSECVWLSGCFSDYQKFYKASRFLDEIAEVARGLNFDDEFPLALLTPEQMDDDNTRNDLATLKFGELPVSSLDLPDEELPPTESKETLAKLLILHFKGPARFREMPAIIKKITIPAPLDAGTDVVG